MSYTLVAPMSFVHSANRLVAWSTLHVSHRPNVLKLVN